MSETLDELYRKQSDCTKCSLSHSATNIVYGFGNKEADVVFIGEAPGYHEDKEGKPFVGAAGKLLTELLTNIGLKRDDIYITNVLKCRPPGNRDPVPEEIEACRPLLNEQLKIINPRIVVTLGSFAARVMLNKTESMSRIHGRPVRMADHLVFPMYHPAAALYARATMSSLEDDFRLLKEILDSEPAVLPEEPAAEQLGLF